MAVMRQPRLSAWRKMAYGGLTAVVFFLIAEGLLFLCNFEPALSRQDPYVGFESSIPLFVAGREHAGTYLQTADSKLKFFNAQRFPKSPPDNTFRIFCVGGSTTFGRPYDDTTSFVAWLRELLQIAANDHDWEVINAGGISYASYRVTAVMEELSGYSPDLFVVYTGHNEFLEERTYRDLFAGSAAVRRLTALLRHTRTYSLAHQLLHDSGSDDRYLLPAEVDAILDHSVGPSSYTRDRQLRERVVRHFELNLARMVEIARSSGAEVLFVKPAANLKDFSPFKSEHRADLDQPHQDQLARLLDEAVALEADGQLRQALATLETAANIDAQYAAVHFHRGRVLFGQRRFAEARTAFHTAIQQDVCSLRAIAEIPRAVERVASDTKAPLVDFSAVVRADCLHRYGHDSPGNEYFLDHVHPTIGTHRLLAVAIMEAMIRMGVVTPNHRWRAEAVASASSRIESRVIPEMQSRALTQLAQVLSWAGKQSEAGPLALEAVRLRRENRLADDPESLFYGAVHLAMTGSNRKATDLLEHVVRLEPHNAEARWRLATLLYDQARYREAELHFVEAVRLNPSDVEAHRMLGHVLIKLHRYQEALGPLQQAMNLQPSDAGCSITVAATLARIGRTEDAIAWYQKSIRLDSDSTQARRQLGQLLSEKGKVAEAIVQWEEILQIDPHAPGIENELRAARDRMPGSASQ